MNRPRWWDVPMPPAVARLPRTRSGMPVVYVTEYKTNGEDDSILSPVNASVAMQDCACAFGIGYPRIGKLCPRRAADAITNHRCGVCGIKIKSGVEAHYVGMTLEKYQEGHEFWDSREPVAHADCVTYSLLTCPRLYTSDNVLIVTTRMPQILARVETGGRGAFYPLSRLSEAVGMLTNYQIVVHPAQAQARTRAQWLADARPLDRPSLKAVAPTPRSSS